MPIRQKNDGYVEFVDITPLEEVRGVFAELMGQHIAYKRYSSLSPNASFTGNRGYLVREEDGSYSFMSDLGSDSPTYLLNRDTGIARGVIVRPRGEIQEDCPIARTEIRVL